MVIVALDVMEIVEKKTDIIKQPEEYKIKWFKSIIPRLLGKSLFKDDTIEIYEYKNSYWVKVYE